MIESLENRRSCVPRIRAYEETRRPTSSAKEIKRNLYFIALSQHGII